MEGYTFLKECNKPDLEFYEISKETPRRNSEAKTVGNLFINVLVYLNFNFAFF